MKANFQQFEKFGLIGDNSFRKLLAESIFSFLNSSNQQYIVHLPEKSFENFQTSIHQILSNNLLRQLCSEDSVLAETITQEVLDFLNRTKKEIIKKESPFQKEREDFIKFQKLNQQEFSRKWKDYSESLKKIYSKSELNLSFYSQEFLKSLDTKLEKDKKQSFESVMEHFQEKWNSLLLKKQIDYELDLIDSYRKKFAEDLYKRLEELNKLKNILNPFTKELGRLWDLSKGSWQRVNFDILKKYAELLEKDKALNELAEMLGKMRKAQEELEEELFNKTIIKTEWKLEHAHKSELVGIHESDDLGNMIPSEIALLSSSELQSIFFKKYTEKKLQTFEYQSKSINYKEEEIQEKRLVAKKLDKGPVIICVDTSGSMHGIPEQVAKTLCFALLKIAIQENRKCYLISFSTSIQTLELTELKNSLEKLLDFLSMSFYGGTDATPALIESIRMLEKNDYKEADILMISDFVMSGLPDHLIQSMNSAKSKNTKFHSLVIGNSQNQQVITAFDNNWLYDTRNTNSMTSIIRKIREAEI
jgi:uncharacterized protein with von Willebrand factor type A (vWA) domain